MKLLEAKIGIPYIIDSMEFCKKCDLTKSKCDVIGLMERGFVVGEEIIIKKIQGGLIHVHLRTLGDYMLRINNINNIIVKEAEGISVR